MFITYRAITEPTPAGGGGGVYHRGQPGQYIWRSFARNQRGKSEIGRAEICRGPGQLQRSVQTDPPPHHHKHTHLFPKASAHL